MRIDENNHGRRCGGMRMLLLMPVIAVLVLSTVTSCQEEKHPLLPGSINPNRFPTMRTTNVSTLISDSGITRYKITSPLWLMFEEAEQPQWKFPKGLHLEKYDDFFRKDATVDCDSATFFKTTQTWRLDGYVNIANMAGEKFLTPQLFWDQRHRKIYSDSFIHIEKSDRIIEGYGFESDEQMKSYRVRNVSGIFPVSDFKKNDNDSTSNVVTAVQPSGPAARHNVGGNDSTRQSVRRPIMQRGTGPTPEPNRPAPARQATAPSGAGGVTTVRRATAVSRQQMSQPATQRQPSRPGRKTN